MPLTLNISVNILALRKGTAKPCGFKENKGQIKCLVSKTFGCSTPAPYSVWRIDLHQTRLDLFCISCLMMDRQMVYIWGKNSIGFGFILQQ